MQHHHVGAGNTSQTAPSSGGATVAVPLQLRYASKTTAYAPCPSATAATGAHCRGFRFAFADLQHPNNFLPPAEIKPSRLRGESRRKCCSMYALSMYESLDQLRDRLRRASATAANLTKLLGDHFVELELAPGDGLRTKADPGGHFDFHESVAFRPSAAVRAHARL